MKTTSQAMTTVRKNYGPFRTVTKSIEATLRHGKAILTCHVQKGVALSRAYKTRPGWYIKYEGAACAMGPWTKANIRELFSPQGD